MEFLKELFGDKALTYDGLKAAVDAAADKIKIANLKEGGYVDKEKFAAKEIEVSTLTAQLKTANDQIDGFKKMDVEGIKAAAEKYKLDYEAAQTKHKADMEKLAFDYALEKALATAKAKNPRAVKALLDVDKLKLDGSTILGLKEQIDPLTTSDPYLFDTEGTDPAVIISKGGGAPAGGIKNPWLKEHYNLTEQGRLLRDDPQKAKAYMAQAGK